MRPHHHLFALLGPLDETVNALPDILAVVQVSSVCKLIQPWASGVEQRASVVCSAVQLHGV